MHKKMSRLFLPTLLALCLAADPVLAEGPMPASALTANDAAPQSPSSSRPWAASFSAAR